MQNTNICYSVSEFIQACNHLLKSCYPKITVQGEISNLIQAKSGHSYFSLKDAQGSIRCACFKQRQTALISPITNGQQVIVRAQTGIYQARGDFQLIVESIKPAGEGALKKQFEILKIQLEQAGLFDQARKQPLPPYPRNIGIVTSSTGAAVQDIISTLNRRCPHVTVTIYPCLVQGNEAKDSICQAINQAQHHNIADLLILARGGGSLEDLWAFNEACVAHAIANCTLPIISGVGHEIDTTIADYVADKRAATPTAAAELACPDKELIVQTVEKKQLQLKQAMQQLLQQKIQQVKITTQQLQHPQNKIQHTMQTLDQYSLQLQHNIQTKLTQEQHQYLNLQQRLNHANPTKQNYIRYQQLNSIMQKLINQINQQIEQKKQLLNKECITLDNRSPSKILTSGYTITMHEGKILRSCKQAKAGDSLAIKCHDGDLYATINK
jgi:exodeoxyribonuclease VII large subunit